MNKAVPLLDQTRSKLLLKALPLRFTTQASTSCTKSKVIWHTSRAIAMSEQKPIFKARIKLDVHVQHYHYFFLLSHLPYFPFPLLINVPADELRSGVVYVKVLVKPELTSQPGPLKIHTFASMPVLVGA
eukprot:1147809-Pelagomonas_calceolata.AAC.3